jgi:hypothetical protein
MQFARRALNGVRSLRSYRELPAVAKAERNRDRRGLPSHDPGTQAVIKEGIAWIGRAQDHSASTDGGVARDYSLIHGWSASYPETTGYIIPTMLSYANARDDDSVRERAKRMLDWLIPIQFPEGGFQGGVIGARPVRPVTFNTGQVLIGLARAVRDFGQPYRESMRLAAEWLVDTQDRDGCWRRHPSPFAEPGEKAYETHVAWGLLEAARVDQNSRYADAALANVKWALGLQAPNGWFTNCCLSDPLRPLSHTLGYALRGILEAYLFTEDDTLLEACSKTADGLLTAVSRDGFLPGRLDAQWRGTVRWACLTGSAQIAYCWLILFKHTGRTDYLNAAYVVSRYVRRATKVDGPPETRGAVKGAFPVSGD